MEIATYPLRPLLDRVRLKVALLIEVLPSLSSKSFICGEDAFFVSYRTNLPNALDPSDPVSSKSALPLSLQSNYYVLTIFDNIF